MDKLKIHRHRLNTAPFPFMSRPLGYALTDPAVNLAGLGIEETAATLDLSAATVKRDWGFARAWRLERLEN